MKIKTPTDEILSVRRELAAQFDNDIKRIGDETRRQQREAGKVYIQLPKREPQPCHTASETIHRSGESERLGDG